MRHELGRTDASCLAQEKDKFPLLATFCQHAEADQVVVVK